VREQCVSRRDMWMIKNTLHNKSVYKLKQLDHGGVRFTVRGLYNKDNQEILTGVVKNESTKF
jgi:hypothetical protein